MPELRTSPPVAVDPSLDRATGRGERRGLDPRMKILLVVAVSITAMSPAGLRFVPVFLALGVGLALWEGARRRALSLMVTAAVLAVLGWGLPAWWPNGVTAIFAFGGTYFLRFTVIAGIGMHLIATTSPTELSAALRAWHAPRALAVTLAVMLRFFPLVAAEARAVLDAMRLRGLAGAAGFVRHPVRAVERFTVPMIAASLRASEDLSASAILRGLGSRRAPTAMHPPRFGIADAVLVLVVAALVAATLVGLPGGAR
ncbi:energy-coupling factor transporter transmembrane component T [Leucobacter musarum]|uniref:energy-coupling factor transporter transmembrane component T n=1 Tax=Leucobacter musarum TaxID=1930747 RepID=UPI001EFB22F3|nr:energy-coupling factor transporter transmembrane component T [Leucobacter musarum]